MFQYFYNESIRKTTLAFGGLFDEIFLAKKLSNGSTEKIRVPITYSGKEKFVRRLTEASSISNNVKIETLLPKLAFEITNFQYDSNRKVNKLNKKFKVTPDTLYQGYSEVPYNIQFGLYCFTRNVDDNLQIIEQILPYFSPEFIVTVKMNDLDSNIDVPIVLNSLNLSDSYEGDMSTRRAVISTFSFTAKAYVYSKVMSSGNGIIKEADINILEDDSTNG